MDLTKIKKAAKRNGLTIQSKHDIPAGYKKVKIDDAFSELLEVDKHA